MTDFVSLDGKPNHKNFTNMVKYAIGRRGVSGSGAAGSGSGSSPSGVVGGGGASGSSDLVHTTGDSMKD